ncbi:hypothetical protein ACJ72_02959 [Emergomyces africanus]|uniref:Inositol oxygenase n=1 Tax=Emergomyces africanus TaxID=1955775 RepID=A0A1B7P117_9EURO|nr:hypothetical protein ACJ72_02959 [Emergomyces africanus]
MTLTLTRPSPQNEHLLQAAEAIHRDDKPRWMQVTCLIHDLGKLLYFFGCAGPVGCLSVIPSPLDAPLMTEIIYTSKPFKDKPRLRPSIGFTGQNMRPGCGMDHVMLSWGHDEYFYNIVKDQSLLLAEALDMLEAVRAFNPYDLYSKSNDIPNAKELKALFLFVSNLGPSHVISISLTRSFPEDNIMRRFMG